MKEKHRYDIYIPLAFLIVLLLLYTTDIYENPDNQIYDTFLRLKRPVSENPDILLLNIDDLAISKVGMFPWTRDIMADGLILLAEFDAGYAVFDIEYTEKSLRGINPDVFEKTFPDHVEHEFIVLSSTVRELLTAVESGAIPPAYLFLYADEVQSVITESEESILSNMKKIERDNDIYLGAAAGFFGKAVFTVSMLPERDEDIPEERKEWARNRFSLDRISVQQDIFKSAVDIRPTILPILGNALTAGFTNIVVDTDGVRRRIDLIIQEDGTFFPQLSFAAVLSVLGNPEITVEKNTILLKGTEEIRIPLAEDNRLLINWPKKKFEESFRHLSYYYLVLHERQEQDLLANLYAMAAAGYLDYYQGETPLLDYYEKAKEIKEAHLAGEADRPVEDYRALRNVFFRELGTFLDSGVDSELVEEIDQILADGGFPEETIEELKGIRQDIRTFFPATKNLYGNLMQTRDILRKEIPGSICLIGWTGTSTTDRGVMPFDESFDNVGTHAAVINTILGRQFLDDLPRLFSALLAVFFTIIVYLTSRRFQPLYSILFGIACILCIAGIGIVLFRSFGLYLQIFMPILAVSFTFIILTILKFILTAREKTFIRNAFGHYLSDTVINQIIDDPDKLSLGGENKYITACFTDVRGFSTISEQLTAPELVTLLNTYLSEMSDIILDLGGTIDKFEGDAIIAFYGAPAELEDHAVRACRAALNMKKAEVELNKRFLAEKRSPGPLLTRIGINTGNMVVGNMGTGRKMDYTIMGNAVNLAARLEGVNKQYGTWILLSEDTQKEADREFVFRKLDRVRVVGINTPVRLFQLVEEKELIDSRTLEMVDLFHQGIDYFEQQRWKEGIDCFNAVLETTPGDGPATTFLERCEKFRKDPPPEGWDGVFNLTSK